MHDHTKYYRFSDDLLASIYLVFNRGQDIQSKKADSFEKHLD